MKKILITATLLFIISNYASTQSRGKYDNIEFYQRSNTDMLYNQMLHKQNIIYLRIDKIREIENDFYMLAYKMKKERNGHMPQGFYDLLVEYRRRVDLYVYYDLTNTDLYNAILADMYKLGLKIFDY